MLAICTAGREELALGRQFGEVMATVEVHGITVVAGKSISAR